MNVVTFSAMIESKNIGKTDKKKIPLSLCILLGTDFTVLIYPV